MPQRRFRSGSRERAALVGLVSSAGRLADGEHVLDELAGLAEAAGAAVVARMVQERRRPDPATYVGRGKLESLAAVCSEFDVDLVIVDDELSPAQLRQLEDRLGCRVVDRTQLILDIFASRARTREGKLQVELAQLEYRLPRLAGSHASLSRLGGGIGTRGPGETKLETDRRRLRDRVTAIRRDLEQLRQRRAHTRSRRSKREAPVVALVGYTNAGKTTLFNRLTRESAVASDALFVTLDPLVRQMRLPGGGLCLLADTVGFIDRLPHALVAAFRATLEEVADADLVVHVIDGARPDRERSVQAVQQVLREVEADEVPRLEAVNKIDRLGAAERRRVRSQHPGAFMISAVAGTGVAQLLAAVAGRVGLEASRVIATFDVTTSEGRLGLAEIYRFGHVTSQVASEGRVVVEADVPRRVADRLAVRALEVVTCAT